MKEDSKDIKIRSCEKGGMRKKDREQNRVKGKKKKEKDKGL
jgi:hypothetical protein